VREPWGVASQDDSARSCSEDEDDIDEEMAGDGDGGEDGGEAEVDEEVDSLPVEDSGKGEEVDVSGSDKGLDESDDAGVKASC